MTLCLLQYQNCLQKFFYNTDSQILLYLARTHYEAEQWQDCKRTLLRAIHLTPSNYTLRFDAGVAMQKFSASTLQKTKRTVDEVNFLFFFLGVMEHNQSLGKSPQTMFLNSSDHKDEICCDSKSGWQPDFHMLCWPPSQSYLVTIIWFYNNRCVQLLMSWKMLSVYLVSYLLLPTCTLMGLMRRKSTPMLSIANIY
jgi:hypothetical protein